LISRRDGSNGRAIWHDFAARKRSSALLADACRLEMPV
jgi:hypothetical protein